MGDKCLRQIAKEKKMSFTSVYEILANYFITNNISINLAIDKFRDELRGGDSNSQKNDEPLEPLSLCDSLSNFHIEQHIKLLKPSESLSKSVIKTKCNQIIDSLKDNPNFTSAFYLFEKPISEYKEFNLPDYYEIIRNPMDFGTMKQKLKEGKYEDIEKFKKDGNLVFDNCVAYNTKQPELGKLATKMKKFFNSEWEKMK